MGIRLAVRAEHILGDVDPLHLADQRVAGPRTVSELEDLRHGAFEGDRRFAHAGGPDGVGVDGGEPRLGELVDIGRVVAAGEGGALHHGVVHQIDHDLPRGAGVGQRVLYGAVPAAQGGANHEHGRVDGEDVEVAEWRQVAAPFGVDRAGERNRPGGHRPDQQAVAVPHRQGPRVVGLRLADAAHRRAMDSPSTSTSSTVSMTLS